MFEKSVTMVEEGLGKYFPSAALAIGVRNKIFVKKTWGETSIYGDGEKINFDTLYDMASLSKVVGTTMVALKFIEDGKLCIDDTVGTFFEAPDDKKDITILRLMTHTSGLPASFLLSECTNSPAGVPDAILNHSLAVPVGSQTIYSCMGFILLAKILEKIGNAPLDQLAQKYVFDPLNMKSTTYHPQGSAACTEFDKESGKCLCGVVHDENSRFQKGVSGNAGLFSSLNDMIKFATMLACDGVYDGRIYLSHAMLAAAVHNYTVGCSEHRGLGFALSSDNCFLGTTFSRKAFGHTGFTGTSIAVDPESGLYVVLLTNRVHPSRDNNTIVRFRRLFHNCIGAEYSRYMQETKYLNY